MVGLDPDTPPSSPLLPEGVPAIQPHRSVYPLRRELDITPQTQRGLRFAIVKDPVTLEYYRLAWTDYELALLLEGAGDVAGWMARWKEKFPSLKHESEEKLLAKAKRLVTNLEASQMCALPAALAMSYQRSRDKNMRATRHLKALTGWLMVRKPMFDPDALLTRIAPKFAFLFQPWFTGLWMILAVGAIWTLVVNKSEVHFDHSWLFSIQNLILLLICLLLLKVVHEFGHGITCKYYGGEVHEVGVMMMCLHPLFYVNCSDAWRIPKKTHRMAVSAAGVYVELIFAVVFVYIWAALAPGFWKDFTMMAILISSVTTVLFNANPLMRFDGYYVLSDWLEIPTLRQRAIQFMGSRFRGLFFGSESSGAERTPEALRESRALAIYAVLSFAYLIFVMWRVLHMLDSLFDQVGLRFVGHILVLMWFVASVAFPLWMFFSRPLKSEKLAAKGKKLRPIAVAGAIVLGLAVVLCMPWGKSITRSCVFEIANPSNIRPEQPGFVTEVLRREGDLVERGDVIVRLRNPALESLAVRQKEAMREVDLELNQAQVIDNIQVYEAFRHQREELLLSIAETTRKLDDLNLRAAARGHILTRNMNDLQGRYFKTGEIVCSITPEGAFDVLVPLSEREARFIQAGHRAEVRLVGLPGESLRGVIVQKPLTTISGELPSSLTSRRGGDVASTISEKGEELLMEKQWYAVLKVDENDEALRSGMTGRVRIQCGPSTIGQLLAQQAVDFINLDYRL